MFTENPITFSDFCNMYLGEGHMDLLREKSRARLKVSVELRAEIAAHYREEIRLKQIDQDHEIISWN
jgi:hypothetical protein